MAPASLLTMLESYGPMVTNTVFITFAYTMVMRDFQGANSSNLVVVLISVVLVTLLCIKFLQIVSSILLSMKKVIDDPVVAGEAPSLTEYTYVATELLRDILKAAIGLLTQTFAVLTGAVIMRLQPQGSSISWIDVIALLLAIMSYYWYLMYALKYR